MGEEKVKNNRTKSGIRTKPGTAIIETALTGESLYLRLARPRVSQELTSICNICRPYYDSNETIEIRQFTI